MWQFEYCIWYVDTVYPMYPKHVRYSSGSQTVILVLLVVLAAPPGGKLMEILSLRQIMHK